VAEDLRRFAALVSVWHPLRVCAVEHLPSIIYTPPSLVWMRSFRRVAEG
jgi:hypothetical protein